jgi:hypothetical protein
MMSLAARSFFYLWVSSLERHSEALLQSDTWARIEGCFPLESISMWWTFRCIFLAKNRWHLVHEGQRRGNTFNSIISSSGSESWANVLWLEGQG